MTARFTKTYVAGAEHIDELGHVNNAIWVQWIQDMSTSHWEAAARPQDKATYFWVVTRHEIDYRGNVAEGESVTGTTWIEGTARGATSVRRVEFRDTNDKVIVSAATTWAILERASNRLARVRPEMLEALTKELD